MKKGSNIHFKMRLYTLIVSIIFFTFLLSSMSITLASNNNLMIGDIYYGSRFVSNRLILDALCTDFSGLDYKKSTITLTNLNHEEEIISLYDGRTVTFDNEGNYIYGDYNKCGFMDCFFLNGLIINIAARRADSQHQAGVKVTLNFELNLVSSSNYSSKVKGKMENEYIDYKVISCETNDLGTQLEMSFDARNFIDRKVNLPIYNTGSYNINAIDYYGNNLLLDFSPMNNHDYNIEIMFDTLEKTYEPINVNITSINGTRVTVAENFSENVYYSKDMIIDNVENEAIDFSNISITEDSRFTEGTITIYLNKGDKLYYDIINSQDDDYLYYALNSYKINGKNTFTEYDADFTYTALCDETIVIEIIDQSYVFDCIQIIKNTTVDSEIMEVVNNGSNDVSVTIFKNQKFKYKYVDSNGMDIIKTIEVNNIVSPKPEIRFDVIDFFHFEALDGSTYIYGDVSAYIVDDYFEYVDKETNKPLSYTFTPDSSNHSYTIKKEDVKILFNGEETNLELEEDIVIELFVDKLYYDHIWNSECGLLKKCFVCGYEDGTIIEHKFETIKYNDEGHWCECHCGTKDEIKKHYDLNGNGNCDRCEYIFSNDPITNPSDNKPKGLSKEAIIGITLGSSLGALTIITGGTIFYIKKKKR